MLRKLTVVAVIVLLAQLPVTGANAPVGKIVPRAGAALNGADLKLETTLFSGDKVTTQADGRALVLLSQGAQVHLGPATAATFNGGAGNVVVSLERGMTVARSESGRQVAVNARGLLVRPSGTAIYEVAIAGNTVVVAARQGNVEVQGTNRTVALAEGKAMRFELANSPQGPVGVGASGFAPIVSVAIATAISVGISIPIASVIAQNKADDARVEACTQIKASISPASAAAGITCR